jgi:hypothetical protein
MVAEDALIFNSVSIVRKHTTEEKTYVVSTSRQASPPGPD